MLPLVGRIIESGRISTYPLLPPPAGATLLLIDPIPLVGLSADLGGIVGSRSRDCRILVAGGEAEGGGAPPTVTEWRWGPDGGRL